MNNLNLVQRYSSEALNKNISLNAGAGTGKTRVLTTRFINILKSQRLTRGRELDQVLAITFTNKATAEMKLRIKKELYESPDSELRKISKYFSKAQIFTIHGFCSDLIRRYSPLVDVSKDFEVADADFATYLFEKSVDESMGEFLDDDRLYDYLRDTKENNIFGIKSQIVKLYYSMRNKSLSVGEIRKWNDEFNTNLQKGDFTKLIDLLDEYALLGPGRKFPKFYNGEEFSLFRKNPYYDLLADIEQNLGDSKKEEIILKREEIKREINYLRSNLEIHNKKYYDLVLDIITSAVKRYRRAKRDYNILDYNDLEDLAYEILKKGINTEYKYILVDEFQDTNPMQVNILMKLTDNLSDRVNLFVVGDPKQSIYGFRGGDLGSYKNFVTRMKDYGCETLEMQENYRSQSTLIESFNSIFRVILKEDYKDINANIEGKEKIKLLTWQKNEDRAVANYIQNLVDSGVRDKDIAVLYRRKNYMQNLENELLKRGIKVNNSSKRFTELAEIRDLMILIKAVENSKDIISTLAFFKSPMVGLDESSIFLMAYNYGIFQEIDENLGCDLDDKNYNLFRLAMETLEYLRGLKKINNLGDFLTEALLRLKYFEVARAGYGEESKYNISKFIKMATDFDSVSSQSKYDFLTYLKKNDEDNSSKAEGVNFMTIHKSKGLEFEHVILCDFNLPIRGRGNLEKFAVDDIGLGIKLEGRDAKYKIINEKEDNKSKEEELRVFYVACTRAKKSLIFSCEAEYSNDNLELVVKKNSFHEVFCESGFGDFEILRGDENTSGAKKIFNIPDKADLNKFKTIKTQINNYLIKDEYIEKKGILNYYSATSFITYKKDPKLFYDRYILGKKEEAYDDGDLWEQIVPIPPDIRGIIVHKYAEVEPENQMKFLSDQLRRYNLEEKDETIDYLMKQIDTYDRNKKGEILEREYEFYFEEKGIYITGQIDQVRKVKDEIQIVDIKTGSLNEELIDLYTLQLQIYTRAYEKIKGVKVSSAFLFSIGDKKEYKVDIRQSEIDKTMMEFKNFVEEVESKRRFCHRRGVK